jgi:hypothetical protein
LDDPLAAAIELASEIASLPIADEDALAHDGPETTAILCRSNVMALTISRRLWEKGHAHRVRRSSVDRPVAGWVGALFGASTALTEAEVAERMGQLGAIDFPGLPTPDTAWDLLCRTDPEGQRRIVREQAVRSRIIVGRVPWGFFEPPSSPLIISSVHSAKGLEFDDCIITGWDAIAAARLDEEARVHFVALTRARHRSFRMESNDHLYKWSRSGGRAFKQGPQTWQTFGMEILGDDVHPLDPCGGLVLRSLDAKTVQASLISSVRPGDEVVLKLLGEHAFGTRHLPIYRVLHLPTLLTIGVTSERFGKDLAGRLKWSREAGNYPSKPSGLSGIRIADLETVAGPPANAEAAGLANTGLWLRPRLIGLGEIHWR